MHLWISNPTSLTAFYLLYLDPGSGSLILQLVLGALLAIGITIRIFWSKIKGWFIHKPAQPIDPPADDHTPPSIDQPK